MATDAEPQALQWHLTFVVLATAAPMAAEPVGQAVQHHLRDWLIAAVQAKLGAQGASPVSCASSTVVARPHDHRPSVVLLALAAVVAELSSEIAPAEA